MTRTETRLFCDLCGKEIGSCAELSAMTLAKCNLMVIETHHGERTFEDICTECSAKICYFVESFPFQESF